MDIFIWKKSDQMKYYEIYCNDLGVGNDDSHTNHHYSSVFLGK